MIATVTALPVRTPARRTLTSGTGEHQTAAQANIAGQLQAAYERGEEQGEERGWALGYAECARRHGFPLLSAVPSGGAS